MKKKKSKSKKKKSKSIDEEKVEVDEEIWVRQITITVRTIINGLCYLATFVFGINAVGLVLYSGQLAINSFMGDSTSKETDKKDDARLSSPNLTANDSSETNSRSGDQNSDRMQ